MTVFDELLNLLTPQRVLDDPRATGAGVTVAVIDTGIDHPRLAAKYDALPAIESVCCRGSKVTPSTGPPSSSHGTTVADIILSIAPKATLFSADVFGSAGTCEVETVVAAIHHAIDVWKVKVINLSLGVPEQKLQQWQRRQALLKVIEEAYYRDVLVFAAAHNEHPLTRSYPAVYSSPLISVDKALFDDPRQFEYLLRDQIEFQAHSRGYLGPFAKEPATSWAAPHLTGIAVRMLSLKPTLKPFELKTILYWMSLSARQAAASGKFQPPG